jgi:DNA primase
MSAPEEIKSRLDLVSFIGRTVTLKRSGSAFSGLCPFHGEKSPSFFVFPERQTWRCFGQCQEGGDIFNFVMKRDGLDFREALEMLAKEAGVELPTYRAEANAAISQARQRLYALLEESAAFYHQALADSPAAAYCIQRGLTEETALRFALGYAPDSYQALLQHLQKHGFSPEEAVQAGVAYRKDETSQALDRFRGRLIIPIRDEKGRTVGFGARALSPDQEPKYLNSPQGALFNKSDLLFAYDQARRAIRESESVVVVEGYLDAIQAHQNGYTNVVASMGTALTEKHLNTLARYAKRIILALDSDSAGQKATQRGLEVAGQVLGDSQRMVLDAGGVLRQAGRLKVDIYVLRLPQGKDPDDFLRQCPQEWPQVISQALPLADYLIETSTADLDPKASVLERERVAHALLPLLTATEDDFYRRENIQRLALRLRLDSRALLLWAEGHTQRLQTKLNAPRPRQGQSAPQTKREQRPWPDATQHYCLGLFVQDAKYLLEADKALREACGPQAALQREDFTDGTYQLIFETLRQAFYQDELEPQEYVWQALDPSLHALLGRLSQPVLESYLAPSAPFQAEVQSIERALAKKPSARKSDFKARVYQLRIQSLQRYIQELCLMQQALDPHDQLETWAAHAHALQETQAALATLQQALAEAQT